MDGAGVAAEGLTAPRASLCPVVGWSLLDLLATGAIVFAVGILAAFALSALRAAGMDLGPSQPALGGMPSLFVPVSLLGTLLAGVALWGFHRGRLPAAPRPWTPRLGMAVVGVAVALQAAAVAFTALMAHLGTPTAGSNLALIDAAFAAAPALTLLMTVLLAPIGEELVFRRVLLHRFAQSGRPWLGLALTSVGFALIHEPLPGDRDLLAWLLTLATYASLGLGFGLLYLRSGRLDAVILAHVLVNAVGMTLLLRA
jgi:membrane protease YdiL (CAAX protease family)